MSSCLMCGKEFVGKRISKVYCSTKCVRLASKQRLNNIDNIIEIRKCRECGEEFKTSDSRKVFCKPRCKFSYRNRMKPKKQQPDRECKVCKKIFSPIPTQGSGSVCCSPECTEENILILQRARLQRERDSNGNEKFISKGSIWAKEDRLRNPDKYRDKDLQRHYGITLDEFNEMLEKQNGVCAICGNPETIVDKKTGNIRALAVDHCHKEGHVRALLCTGCNQGLGNFKDSIELLNKAITYLAT